MRYRLSVLFTLGLLLGACGGVSPKISVLGVTDTRAWSQEEKTLVVFLEVVNPTKLDMRLSRLEYRLDAQSWVSLDGNVALSRWLGPQSATVIEVPVKVQRKGETEESDAAGAVAYLLEGRLFTISQRVERSWSVKVEGTLSSPADSDATAGGPRMRVRIAEIGE